MTKRRGGKSKASNRLTGCVILLLIPVVGLIFLLSNNSRRAPSASVTLAQAQSTVVPTRVTEQTRVPPTLTAVPATATPEAITYYARSSVNIRACPKTTCALVKRLAAGAAVQVVGEATGESVSGSTTWLRVDNGGTVVYIHSSLVSTTYTAVSTSRPAATQPPAALPTVRPTVQPAQPPASAGCNGARTCGEMTSCNQAYACLQAGNSRLDQDKDGVPCESLCQ